MDFLSGPTDQKITFGSRGLRLRITRFTQQGSKLCPRLLARQHFFPLIFFFLRKEYGVENSGHISKQITFSDIYFFNLLRRRFLQVVEYFLYFLKNIINFKYNHEFVSLGTGAAEQ